MSEVAKSPRPAPFSIRFSQGERAAIESAAGSMPLGSYIKSVVLASEAPKYRKRSKPPVAEAQLLAELLARLGQTRHANNLNQIAKHLNQGSLVMDAELEADIQAALLDIAWMRMTLMQALGIKS
ncbi:MAG: hypothetical protein AAFQ05_00285 [Pseudomonadota bacterium]